jgi:hypothetical protein
VPHDPAIVPVYDDKLDGVSGALSAGRELRPRLIASASLMANTKGVDRKNRGPATEAVDGGQSLDYGLIDIVASAPFRDAFCIALPTIKKLVYVLFADHVAGREALKAALKKNRSASAFGRQ